MNLIQFLRRWPAKDSRIFLFGGGRDQDRLFAYNMVTDHWKAKIDSRMDLIRLQNPSMIQVAESLRTETLGPMAVVAATEMAWVDPDEIEDDEKRQRARYQFDVLSAVLKKMPRDRVLIASTPHENPLTKNDLAQIFITKGYWVVLKNVDVETALELLRHITAWDDEELLFEIVESVGTLPSELIQFLRTVRLAYPDPTPDQVREYLTGFVRGGVFEITDAIVMKKLDKALSISRDDVPIGQVIGAVDRKLTSLVSFMAEMKRGRTPKEAAAMLRLPGFIVHGLYEASKRWTPPEILMLYKTLAEYSVAGEQPGALDLMIRDLVGT